MASSGMEGGKAARSTRRERRGRGALLCLLPLAALLLLCAPAAFVPDAAHLALLPMGALFLLLLLGRVSIAVPFRNGGPRLPALALTALFFLLLSIPNLLSAPLFSESGLSAIWWPYRWLRLLYLIWNWLGFLPLYALSVYCCFYYALQLALRPRADSLPAKRFAGLYLALLPMLGTVALCVLSSSPSLVIGDAPTVWAAARDGLWSDWHCIGYLLFVRMASLGGRSQTLVVLVQAAAYLYVHSAAMAFLARQGCGGRALRVYALSSVLAFVPIFFLQAILKDTVFTIALLALGVGALNIVNSEKPRARDWAFMAAFGLCVCLFRHAGFLPVVATFAALIVRALIRKRPRALLHAAASAACVGVCYALIVNVLGFGVLKAERNPKIIQYGAPMTMVGAAAASGVPLAEEDVALMEQVMPLEKWAACYEKYFADALSRSYAAIGEDVNRVTELELEDDILRLNARLLIAHPVVYVCAFFDLNSLMWEIATPADGYVRSYLGYPVTPIAELVTAEGYAEEGLDRVTKELKQAEDTTFSAAAPLTNRYAEFLYGQPILRSILWRGGFALLCVAFAAVVLGKKRRARDLIGMLPLLAVTLGMLFSMPAQEVRYIFPNIEYALLFAVYAVFAPACAPIDRTPGDGVQ